MFIERHINCWIVSWVIHSPSLPSRCGQDTNTERSMHYIPIIDRSLPKKWPNVERSNLGNTSNSTRNRCYFPRILEGSTISHS
jgi:hypothetical protein